MTFNGITSSPPHLRMCVSLVKTEVSKEDRMVVRVVDSELVMLRRQQTMAEEEVQRAEKRDS